VDKPFVMTTQTLNGWWRPTYAEATVDRPTSAQAVAGRPGGAPVSAVTEVAVPRTDREQIAFGALVAFTIILLVSPQAWFPAIKSLRIALLAAMVAMTAHFLSRAFGRTIALPVRREVVIALAMVTWAALTIPMSIWPGGSLSALTDHLIKAVVFFWLIGTLVTSEQRLKFFAWMLSLCSLPLAVTAINNYREGVFVTNASYSVQRIAGYVGAPDWPATRTTSR
jgi:hypothetical protein